MMFLVNTCPSKDSSSRFSMNHTPQLPIHAHVHFVIIFKFLISHQLLFLSSYKTWKDQISDIGAGCVNKTYHDLSIRRNGCSALVRMPTKECHTTKNTNTSQERNNFSVDMEEESSDMDKFKYVWCMIKLRQYLHQTIMQFFQSVMKGI